MRQHHSEYRRQRIRERSILLFVFLFVIAFMLISGAILAFYFLPNPHLLFAREDDRPRNRLVQISMLGSEFYVPQSILRRVKRRVFGSVEQIDVQIPWPYDQLAVISGTIRETSDFRDWVLITIVQRPNRLPLDERYARVDKYYFAGPPAKGPGGLVKYDFLPDSPYRDLQLFVDAQGRNPAAIRCDLKASSLGPILCEREVTVTPGLTARIRFARGHLKEWRQIEQISRNVIHALLRGAVAG